MSTQSIKRVTYIALDSKQLSRSREDSSHISVQDCLSNSCLDLTNCTLWTEVYQNFNVLHRWYYKKVQWLGLSRNKTL